MRARLEIICHSNQMISALIYLWKSENEDSCVIMQLFKLMRQIQHNENKQFIENGVYPFTVNDIALLTILDPKQKYLIEKSYTYICYKVLWIMDMQLRGKNFQDGDLNYEQYKIQVFRIAEYIVGQKFFIDILIDFDAKVFLRVASKLFFQQPYWFLDRIKNQSSLKESVEPNQILDSITQQIQDKSDAFQQESKQQDSTLLDEFLFFILSIQVEHSKYYDLQSGNIKRHNLGQIRELTIPSTVLHNAIEHGIKQLIKSILLHFNNSFEIEEAQIIEAIKQLIKNQEQMIDTLLQLLTEIDQNNVLFRIRIFLLEEKGEFLQSFKLHIRKKHEKTDIFKWINHKFELLDAKMVGQNQRLNQLKSCVASQMKDIIEIDAQKVIELIEYWYDKSFYNQLIVGELSEYPHLQYKFIKQFLLYNEEDIRITFEDQSNDNKEILDRYVQYICLFVRLLCQLQSCDQYSISEDEIVSYVSKEYFPVAQCKTICQEYNQHRAVSALLERDGEFQNAIQMNIKYLLELDCLEMGKELLKAIQDSQRREQSKSKEKIKFSDDIDELILKHGNKYDFLNCYYYRFLNQFDKTVLRTCELANKATLHQGSAEIWFNVLMGLGQYSDSIKQKLEQLRKQNSDKYKLTVSFFLRYSFQIQDIEKLIHDFIVKRKAYIIITYSTFNISAKDSLDKLGLDLRSIQYIFDFKLKDNKMEERLIKIANALIKKEVLVAGKIKQGQALKGLQLEGDHTSIGGLLQQLTQKHVAKDMCDICDLELIYQRNKTSLRVYIQCGHTFHAHCVSLKQREEPEVIIQGVPKNSKCHKCTQDNTDFLIAPENVGVGVKSSMSSEEEPSCLESNLNYNILNVDGNLVYGQEKSESLKEQYVEMFSDFVTKSSLNMMDF